MIEIENELYAALQTLGEDVVMELAQGLVRARKLHPRFATGASHGARVVHDEAVELFNAAYEQESPDRQHAEALDTAVTAIRFMRMDWMPKFGAEEAIAAPGRAFRPAQQVRGEGAAESRSELSEYIVWCEDGAANDPVNHPSHYTAGAVECIDAIQAALTPEEFAGYCKGSIMKYTWRERHKGGNESLRKGRWYMDRLLGSREG